jgi:hypothetical protein
LLGQLEYLEREIDQFSVRFEDCLLPFLSAKAFVRLDAVPEVNRLTIENVVREIDVNMKDFPAMDHLSGHPSISSIFPIMTSPL